MFLPVIKKTEKGFTMIEILVVMFILSLLLVPIFRVMVLSYGTVQEEKLNAEERDNFRFFSTFLIEDLLYSQNAEVAHTGDYDILSYTTKSGKVSQVYFHKEKGIMVKQSGELEIVTKGEKHDKGLPLVRIEKDGIIHFNFYSRDLNILFVTSVKPRPNGGMM